MLKFYTDTQRNNRTIYEIFIFLIICCDVTHTSLIAVLTFD